MNVSRNMDTYTTSMENQSMLDRDCLELPGKILDGFFLADDSFHTLIGKMQINKGG